MLVIDRQWDRSPKTIYTIYRIHNNGDKKMSIIPEDEFRQICRKASKITSRILFGEIKDKKELMKVIEAEMTPREQLFLAMQAIDMKTNEIAHDMMGLMKERKSKSKTKEDNTDDDDHDLDDNIGVSYS